MPLCEASMSKLQLFRAFCDPELHCGVGSIYKMGTRLNYYYNMCSRIHMIGQNKTPDATIEIPEFPPRHVQFNYILRDGV